MYKTNSAQRITMISYPYLVLAQEEVIKVIKMQMVLQYTENREVSYFSLDSAQSISLTGRQLQLYSWKPQLLLTWRGGCLPEIGGLPRPLCGLSQPCPSTYSFTSQLQSSSEDYSLHKPTPILWACAFHLKINTHTFVLFDFRKQPQVE